MKEVAKIVMQVAQKCDVFGQYLKAFDPNVHAEGIPFPTGLAEFTEDPEEALGFSSVGVAMQFYQMQSSVTPLRPDGKPNRPLTSWTMSITTVRYIPASKAAKLRKKIRGAGRH